MIAVGSLHAALAAAVATLFALAPRDVAAQDYPTRPVTVVVPFAPGALPTTSRAR